MASPDQTPKRGRDATLEVTGPVGQHQPKLLQPAALLLVLGLALLMEAVVRVISVGNTPSGHWAGNHATFPPIVLLLGAIIELLMGLFTIATAASIVIFDTGATSLTLATLTVQMLGWFTFVVYTIAEPAFASARNHGPLFTGLTQTQSNTAVAMMILGNIAYCTALQGGAVFFTVQILRTQQGGAHLYTGSYYASRVVFFSVLMFLAGFASVVLGGLVRSKLGSGQLMPPVSAAPFVVFYPELTITDGVFLLIGGLWGVAKGVTRFPRGKDCGSLDVPFLAFFGFLLLIELTFHIMGQLALAGPMAAGGGAMLTWLVFALLLMPTHLAAQMDCEGRFLGYSERTSGADKLMAAV